MFDEVIFFRKGCFDFKMLLHNTNKIEGNNCWNNLKPEEFKFHIRSLLVIM